MSTVDTYNIDRKAASRLLKVSIRTVDRYVKQKKLSTRRVDGRIWLDKKEIEEFKDRRSRQVKVDNVDMSTSHLSIDKQVDRVDTEVDKVDKVDKRDSVSRVELVTRKGVDEVSSTPRRATGAVYKKLFEDLKQEVAEKQARLEIANYRVGQLETQVKNSIPLLEYHREQYEKDEKEQELKKELEQSMNLIKKLAFQLKYARLSKKIFIGVLLVILALQPLWLLLAYDF